MIEELSMYLRHPLLLIIVGTGLFGFLNHLRTRREARRQKAIEFLDEISVVINKPLSGLFGRIRAQEAELDKELDIAIGRVFTSRLGVRVKSEAYLGTTSFWRFYMSLGREFRRARGSSSDKRRWRSPSSAGCSRTCRADPADDRDTAR